MIVFGAALPSIRGRVEHDFGIPELPRPKVLATIVRLMEMTLIRVGNEEYARQNKSYGLTMRNKRNLRIRPISSTAHEERIGDFTTTDICDVSWQRNRPDNGSIGGLAKVTTRSTYKPARVPHFIALWLFRFAPIDPNLREALRGGRRRRHDAPESTLPLGR
jgi:hypothetical protein